MKICFLDRDGTIVKDYEDSEWSMKHSPEFIDGIFECLRSISQLGFKLIIITNQNIIGEGYITLEMYKEFQEKMINELSRENIEILDTFYCPHKIRDNCNCRKPKLGLIEKAVNKYSSIEIEKSIVIGDSECDMAIAMQLKIRGFYLGEKNIENEKIIKINSIAEIEGIIKNEK